MTLFAAGMTKRPSAGATLMTFGLLSWIVACQTLVRSNDPTAASLRTDSAEVGVRFNGKAYSAKIGFVYGGRRQTHDHHAANPRGRGGSHHGSRLGAIQRGAMK